MIDTGRQQPARVFIITAWANLGASRDRLHRVGLLVAACVLLSSGACVAAWPDGRAGPLPVLNTALGLVNEQQYAQSKYSCGQHNRAQYP